MIPGQSLIYAPVSRNILPTKFSTVLKAYGVARKTKIAGQWMGEDYYESIFVIRCDTHTVSHLWQATQSNRLAIIHSYARLVLVQFGAFFSVPCLRCLNTHWPTDRLSFFNDVVRIDAMKHQRKTNTNDIHVPNAIDSRHGEAALHSAVGCLEPRLNRIV